jgi:hypothetical protein
MWKKIVMENRSSKFQICSTFTTNDSFTDGLLRLRNTIFMNQT